MLGGKSNQSFALNNISGKLFYLDPETGTTGCHCRPDWSVYYWTQTGQCFEQESPGPCPPGMYFAFNASSGTTECNCFKNFVRLDNDDASIEANDLNAVASVGSKCVELGTQGPCPAGQVVTADPRTGSARCDCGPRVVPAHYWPATGRCYPHYVRGPCGEGEQFRPHPSDPRRPACIVWGRTSFSSGYKKK